MQQLAAQNASLQDKLMTVKAELAAERETGAVLRRTVRLTGAPTPSSGYSVFRPGGGVL
jgi:hypothetical protein